MGIGLTEGYYRCVFTVMGLKEESCVPFFVPKVGGGGCVEILGKKAAKLGIDWMQCGQCKNAIIIKPTHILSY